VRKYEKIYFYNETSISMILYGREIKKLNARYPQVTVEKEKPYLDTKLFVCKIHK